MTNNNKKIQFLKTRLKCCDSLLQIYLNTKPNVTRINILEMKSIIGQLENDMKFLNSFLSNQKEDPLLKLEVLTYYKYLLEYNMIFLRIISSNNDLFTINNNNKLKFIEIKIDKCKNIFLNTGSNLNRVTVLGMVAFIGQLETDMKFLDNFLSNEKNPLFRLEAVIYYRLLLEYSMIFSRIISLNNHLV